MVSSLRADTLFVSTGINHIMSSGSFESGGTETMNIHCFEGDCSFYEGRSAITPKPWNLLVEHHVTQ